MAQLDKNAYYGKMIYAGKKMAANKEIQTLTEEQHDALSQMCSARHELHANIDSLVRNRADDEIEEYLIEANKQLKESGLPIIKGIPTTTENGEFINIDYIELLIDCGKAPERYSEDEEGNEIENDEYWEWRNKEYERIFDEWEKLNYNIEKYLERIDKKHGTHYAPTGSSRIF